MKQLPPQGALTTTYNGRARELHSSVHLTLVNSSDSGREYDGLWDTGATNTVISQKVVKELKLKPVGVAEVFTPQGKHRTNTFLVEMLLPGSKLRFGGLRVTLGKLSNCDVLIGMDIIGFGDFTVTNKNGITVMTFRVPSIHTTDYVKLIDQQRKSHFAKPKRRKKGKKR